MTVQPWEMEAVGACPQRKYPPHSLTQLSPHTVTKVVLEGETTSVISSDSGKDLWVMRVKQKKSLS